MITDTFHSYTSLFPKFYPSETHQSETMQSYFNSKSFFVSFFAVSVFHPDPWDCFETVVHIYNKDTYVYNIGNKWGPLNECRTIKHCVISGFTADEIPGKIKSMCKLRQKEESQWRMPWCNKETVKYLLPVAIS